VKNLTDEEDNRLNINTGIGILTSNTFGEIEQFSEEGIG
jgi:hypothetical protein